MALEYDTAGRMVAKKIRPTGGAGGAVTESVETTYGTSLTPFNKGRVTQMVTKNGAGVEQNGKLLFEYDALGRVKKQTRTIDGTNYIVEKNFDAAGYLRGIKYPDNDVVGQFGGTGTALGYDQAGRLSSIPGILTSVTYNALGAPLVQTNANGTTTTKTFDVNRLWLTDIDTAAPGAVTLQQLSYTLNASGMATEVASNNINEAWTYDYDPDLNFLKSAVNGVAPGTANNQTWSYDSLGRFTGNSRVGTSYTYPSSGPTSVRPHAPTSISGGSLGTLNFSYDANGNLSTGNGRTMTWDAENRIKQVVKGAATTTFTYGPDGTRIKKVSGTTTVAYPFGDDYEINGTTVTKYIGAGFGTLAKRVSTKVKNKTTIATYWLHADRLGSVNAVTDNGGAQVLRQGFRTYGEIFGKTTVGGHTESLDYIGERTDSETGLTYLHARYYDPILGAFLSPDPIGADRNTYRYSFGDSVNFRDPSGLCGESYSGFSTDIYGVVTQTQPSSGVDCDWSDEGEIARSRAAFQNYLNDHNYPAPLRGRLGCVANPDQERCRPDPDDPCALDATAEGCGPVDPCAVDSNAEGCSGCPVGLSAAACVDPNDDAVKDLTGNVVQDLATDKIVDILSNTSASTSACSFGARFSANMRINVNGPLGDVLKLSLSLGTPASFLNLATGSRLSLLGRARAVGSLAAFNQAVGYYSNQVAAGTAIVITAGSFAEAGMTAVIGNVGCDPIWK